MRTNILATLCARLRSHVETRIPPLTGTRPAFILFFSVSDGNKRAEVFSATGSEFAIAWRKGVQGLEKLVTQKRISARLLRVDWVESVERSNWAALQTHLTTVKRNYFRLGLSLDEEFQHAFLETELNANAMLYGGPTISHAVLNVNNFQRYAAIRHGLKGFEFSDEGEVHPFSTRGVFTTSGSDEIHFLDSSERDSGRRTIDRLAPDHERKQIVDASGYLAKQIGSEGRFCYGWHPCFDRPINSYNSLRHASTLYAMIEAWEVMQDAQLMAAIERGLGYLTGTLIRQVVLDDGQTASFLVDQNDEIKLGGNAVCLLAFVKYSELTGTSRYGELLEQLALGILHMQDRASGKFCHVLHYPSLQVKEEFRIIYYDGEAAFGLMRLYSLTSDPRWLEAVEQAFVHFIAAEHWKAHDHWLSYCVNELTRHRPLEAYYRFGIRNFCGYLDFVEKRITTFPTLLELMMAAQKMIARLEAEPEHRHLLEDVDLDKFYRALHTRAHYLLNGHFWPELAMYFANPARITGSFFIRHHAFRVRIDDVEHYLSGFVAYLNFLRKRQEPSKRTRKAAAALLEEAQFDA